jgi:hypothetical protein
MARMGRKSSAKSHLRDPSKADAAGASSQGAQPPDGPRSSVPAIVAILAVVVAVAGFAYVKSGRAAAPTASTVAEQPGAAQAAAAGQAVPPRWPGLGPHKQANLPPLPTQAYPPPRPTDVVRAAYLFAAEHPEILSYVPCFCGCERGGHRGNEDCFVSARDAKGDVTEWEPHGLECTVCIDVATEARQMFASGASVRDIRAAVEKKYAGFNGGHTPTAAPPSQGSE